MLNCAQNLNTQLSFVTGLCNYSLLLAALQPCIKHHTSSNIFPAPSIFRVSLTVKTRYTPDLCADAAVILGRRASFSINIVSFYERKLCSVWRWDQREEPKETVELIYRQFTILDFLAHLLIMVHAITCLLIFLHCWTEK